MVLSDHEIWMEISSRRLSFDPQITPDQVSPSSVDLRLSNQFSVFKPPTRGVTTTINLTEIDNIESVIERYVEEETVADGKSFVLKPKALVLAYTREYIKLRIILLRELRGGVP